MKSFDEFFKENFEDGLSDPSKYILKFTFEAGQQSKQAEVDELQKRVDEALRFYNDAKLPNNIGMMQMAIYLKGDKDETGLN